MPCKGRAGTSLVDVLLVCPQHPEPTMRYEYAHAHTLDCFGDGRCAEPLRKGLDDRVPRVRRMALHSLGCEARKLTPPQAETDFVARAIDRALNEPSINVRRHATSALGICNDDPRDRGAEYSDRMRERRGDPPERTPGAAAATTDRHYLTELVLN